MTPPATTPSVHSKSPAFQLEEWAVRPDICTVTSEQESRRLEPKVMDLLVELCRHPGVVLSKDELLTRVWHNTFVKEVALSRAISAIRRELGDDARQPRLIETIPKRGYRLIGAVSLKAEVDAADAPGTDALRSDVAARGPVAAQDSIAERPREQSTANRTDPPSAPPDFTHLRRWAMPWIAMPLAAVLWLVGWVILGPLSLPMSQSESISVLPLRVLGSDPELTYLADGLTEEIRSRLSAVPRLRVVSGTTSNRYRDSRLPLPKIADQLEVQRLLEGSIQRGSERLTIHLRLVDGTEDRQIWAGKWTLESHELFEVQGEIARQVGSALQASLYPTHVHGTDLGTDLVAAEPSAYSLYVRARGHYRQFNPTDNARAIELFELALQADTPPDSRFPLALAGLANAYGLQVANFGGPTELAEKAENLAREALSLAPDLPEAHKALGLALSQMGRPRQALTAYRQAIELRPNYDEAIHNTAFLLYQLGEWDEAGRWQPSPAPNRRPLM